MKTGEKFWQIRVALLAEGVDRNKDRYFPTGAGDMSPSSRRAWIEITGCGSACKSNRSPSSRRAWIEIRQRDKWLQQSFVALLAEGVDRNNNGNETTTGSLTSPSSRRAWIEILRVRANTS